MTWTRPASSGGWTRPADPLASAAASTINPWIEVVKSGAGANEVAVDSETPVDANSLINTVTYSNGWDFLINKDAVADGFAEGASFLWTFKDGDGDALDMAGGKIGIKFLIDIVTDPATEVIGITMGLADTGGDFTDSSCVVVGCLHRGHASSARYGQVYRTSDLTGGSSSPTAFEGWYMPGMGAYGYTGGGYRNASGVVIYKPGQPAALNDTDIKGCFAVVCETSAGGTASMKYRLYYTWFELATEPS